MNSRATRRRVTTYTNGIKLIEVKLYDRSYGQTSRVAFRQEHYCYVAHPVWPVIEYDFKDDDGHLDRSNFWLGHREVFRSEILAQLLPHSDVISGYGIEWDPKHPSKLVVIHPDENVLMHIKLIVQL